MNIKSLIILFSLFVHAFSKLMELSSEEFIDTRPIFPAKRRNNSYFALNYIPGFFGLCIKLHSWVQFLFGPYRIFYFSYKGKPSITMTNEKQLGHRR